MMGDESDSLCLCVDGGERLFLVLLQSLKHALDFNSTRFPFFPPPLFRQSLSCSLLLAYLAHRFCSIADRGLCPVNGLLSPLVASLAVSFYAWKHPEPIHQGLTGWCLGVPQVTLLFPTPCLACLLPQIQHLETKRSRDAVEKRSRVLGVLLPTNTEIR
jgi:hypothetical protein